MEKIDASKGAGHQWECLAPAKINACGDSCVWKDVVIAHFAKHELNVVGMSSKIFDTMQALSKAAKSFAEVFFSPFGVTTAGVGATEVDAAIEGVPDVARAGRPVAALIGNVVLHAGFRVELQLDRLNWWAETRVILTTIDIVIQVLGIVDVLLWPMQWSSARASRVAWLGP